MNWVVFARRFDRDERLGAEEAGNKAAAELACWTLAERFPGRLIEASAGGREYRFLNRKLTPLVDPEDTETKPLFGDGGLL